MIATILPTDEVVKGMIAIPAGQYLFGQNSTPGDLEEERTIMLDAFYLDATEVSNAQYREFVQATGHEPPAHWDDPYDPAIDDLPVVRVSQRDAQLYARWRGKRLPTVFEWEMRRQGAGWSTVAVG